MKVQAAILAATVFAPLSAFAGMYGDPVINLDAKSFKKAMATEHAAMVAFVAPWCGHCKTLAPEFTAAAASLSPLIPFYAIDCDAAANKPLCGEQGVQGFPTIKAFPRAGKGASRDYRGERKKGALVDYTKELVPDRVKKLRADDGADKVLSKFLEEKSGLPHALLIHPSAPSIPFLWKVLGHQLSSQMFLGFIRDTTSHDILTSLGIYDSADTTRDATRAVVWKVGADKPDLVEFEGAMKFNALLEWLQGFIPGQSPKPTPKSDSKTDKANAKKAEKALKAEAKREGGVTGMGTGTEDAYRAEPETVAEEAVMKDGSGGAPADPVPEDEAVVGESAAGAAKTASREEL